MFVHFVAANGENILVNAAMIQWLGDPGNGVTLRISPNLTIGVQGSLNEAQAKLNAAASR